VVRCEVSAIGALASFIGTDSAVADHFSACLFPGAPFLIAFIVLAEHVAAFFNTSVELESAWHRRLDLMPLFCISIPTDPILFRTLTSSLFQVPPPPSSADPFCTRSEGRRGVHAFSVRASCVVPFVGRMEPSLCLLASFFLLFHQCSWLGRELYLDLSSCRPHFYCFALG